MNRTQTPLDYLPTAGFKPSLQSAIAARIAGSRDPIARLRAGHELVLYYEVGDAHSQLCASLARRILPRLRVSLTIRLVPAPDSNTYPEQERQRAFAREDAVRLAPCHGLPAPVVVQPAQRAEVEAHLAEAGSDAASFLAREQACMLALSARQPLPSPELTAAATHKVLNENARHRRRLGHYLPAMWQYRGEWFWAMDRLQFLHARLLADDGLLDPAPLSNIDARQLVAPEPDSDAALEFWFSFRSPYSYLAAAELLRGRNHGRYPRLQVRPVLPMVMRGLPVPRIKRLYIVRDVKRSADAMGIPFGRIHDPVGDGVFRLLTVFPHDATPEVQLRYCAIAGQTVWAEGLDLRRDDVLRSVVDRCGLDWSAAQAKLALGFDTRAAEAHRAALFDAGLWGVPSFRLGSFTTWGQDRLWMIDALVHG